jgi:hypothetical protein
MAAAAHVDVRTVVISGVLPRDMRMRIVTLPDRRTTPPSAPIEWMFKIELEELLYCSAIVHGTSGAVYRLLKRSGADTGLTLRSISIQAGLVTASEFAELKALLHTGVRVMTLVALTNVETALATYGATTASRALRKALGMPPPEDWDEEEVEVEVDAESDEEEGGDDGGGDGDGDEEEEEAEASGEDGDEDGDEENDAEDDGEEEEEAEEEEEEEEQDGDEESDAGGSGEGGAGSSSANGTGGNMSDDDDPTASVAPSQRAVEKRKHSVAFEAPPTLGAELASFRHFRTVDISRSRKGKGVAAATAETDERRIRSFLKYLVIEKGINVATLRVLASPKIGAVVHGYITHKALTCTYSTIANEVGSLVAAMRFVHASLTARGATVNAASVDELVALLNQCISKGRAEAKFRVATKPKAWLDWAQCQRARLAAETAFAEYTGDDAAYALKLVRDVCLLVLLTGLPPDRVSVYRRLRLGDTLKSTDDGYQIDLCEPGLHKTAAVFGPSCTTVTSRVARAIATLVTLDALADGDFLFHAPLNRAVPRDATMWGRLVKATFKQYSGVSLCPKDCRGAQRHAVPCCATLTLMCLTPCVCSVLRDVDEGRRPWLRRAQVGGRSDASQQRYASVGAL